MVLPLRLLVKMGFFLFLSWLCAGSERHDCPGLFVRGCKGKTWQADEMLCVFNIGQQYGNCERRKSLPWLVRRSIRSASDSTQNLSQELNSKGRGCKKGRGATGQGGNCFKISEGKVRWILEGNSWLWGWWDPEKQGQGYSRAGWMGFGASWYSPLQGVEWDGL